MGQKRKVRLWKHLYLKDSKYIGEPFESSWKWLNRCLNAVGWTCQPERHLPEQAWKYWRLILFLSGGIWIHVLMTGCWHLLTFNPPLSPYALHVCHLIGKRGWSLLWWRWNIQTTKTPFLTLAPPHDHNKKPRPISFSCLLKLFHTCSIRLSNEDFSHLLGTHHQLCCLNQTLDRNTTVFPSDHKNCFLSCESYENMKNEEKESSSSFKLDFDIMCDSYRYFLIQYFFSPFYLLN